jgi:DNA-binding transcriptional LysR family regulator
MISGMNIDPTRLYRLSVVIEEKNLSRAAKRLGLSQPALSASIAQFEREVGMKLLDRGRHGAFPTAYGNVLYERSKVIEAELKRASQNLEEVASAEAGHLAIGAASGAAVGLMWQSVARVLKQRPGITVELTESWSAAELLEKLRRRELDWVITPQTEKENAEGLENQPLFKTRRIFAVRSGHPILKTKPPDVVGLMRYPLVAPEPSNDLRRYVEDILLQVGGRLPRIGAIGNSLALAKEIVLSSDHFAVLTEAVVHDEIKSGLLKAIEIPVSTDYWYRILRHAKVSITPTAAIFRRELDAECRARGLHINGRRRTKVAM